MTAAELKDIFTTTGAAVGTLLGVINLVNGRERLSGRFCFGSDGPGSQSVAVMNESSFEVGLVDAGAFHKGLRISVWCDGISEDVRVPARGRRELPFLGEDNPSMKSGTEVYIRTATGYEYRSNDGLLRRLWRRRAKHD